MLAVESNSWLVLGCMGPGTCSAWWSGLNTQGHSVLLLNGTAFRICFNAKFIVIHGSLFPDFFCIVTGSLFSFAGGMVGAGG